ARPPATSSGATMNGTTMEAIRPMPAAQPAPVPRVAVGYDSGVIAYSAPQAPRLKNDRASPKPMIAGSPGTVPKRTADTADPVRKTASVVRRPHTSMSHAATRYPGSWASVMMSVNQNAVTSGYPSATRIEGIQRNAP